MTATPAWEAVLNKQNEILTLEWIDAAWKPRHPRATVREAINEADRVILEYKAGRTDTAWLRAHGQMGAAVYPIRFGDYDPTRELVSDFDRVMFGIEPEGIGTVQSGEAITVAIKNSIERIDRLSWRWRNRRRWWNWRPRLAAWQTDMLIVAVTLTVCVAFASGLVEWLAWNAWTLGIERWWELVQRSSGKIDPR